MKRRGLIIAAVLVVLAVAAALAWRQRPLTVDVIEPTFAPLTRSLQFSARVATTSRVNVGSTLTGRVAAVNVREGARVNKGDPLVLLETDELQTALAQAQAGAQQAQARLGSVRSSGRAVAQAQVAQAVATLTAAERELARTQQLVAQGFLSPAKLDDARKAVQLARAQQDSARAQQQALGDGGSDLAQAQAQLAQAQAAQQAAQARLAQATVRAPTDGRVLTRSVEPGQIVQPGSALLSLALDGPTQLVAQVDERFLDQLQTGQSARVVADAFPAQPFAAQVLSIAPGVDAQRGAIEIKLRPEQAPPAFLREDMTLSVEVRTGQRPRALVLPVRALRGLAPSAGGGGLGLGQDASSATVWPPPQPSPSGGGGEPPASPAHGHAVVWVVTDGRVQPRAVTLGLRTLEAVEITAGLAAGEPVVLQGDAQPGARVRPRVVPWQPGQAGAAGSAGDAGAALTNAMGR